jgi:nitrogen fixation/metabolism regulation signal transduction histidine kinase
MTDTYFAPPQRTERRKFINQVEFLSQNPIMTTMLQSVAGLLVVLNEDRQIVALNSTFLQFLGITDPQKTLGLRLGESLKCVHAESAPGGCGTGPYCQTCGAVIAMMAAIENDIPSEQVCALTIEQNGGEKDLCLIVRSQPVIVDNCRWILIFVQDITQQHFWMNLERVFFHDIRNILCSLMNKSELLSLDMPKNKSIQDIFQTTQRLNDEISLHGVLSTQKSELHFFKKSSTTINDIRHDLEQIVDNHHLNKNRTLTMSWPDENIPLHTVSLMVSRVLGNMILNAFEASENGDVVRMNTVLDDQNITWHVWNRQTIPAEIQMRIFQRYFTTKASPGRGLGTYSMKLFGEKYLNGQVGFISNPKDGTTFSFSIPR